MPEKKLNNEQIQAYLKKLHAGTLTNNERWQLEKASLDDPFLEDALEGYYNNTTDHQPALAALSDRIIKDSATKPTRRIISGKWLTMAASVALLLGVSVWIFDSMSDHNMDKAVAVKAETSKAAHQEIDQQGDMAKSAVDGRVAASKAGGAANKEIRSNTKNNNESNPRAKQKVKTTESDLKSGFPSPIAKVRPKKTTAESEPNESYNENINSDQAVADSNLKETKKEVKRESALTDKVSSATESNIINEESIADDDLDIEEEIRLEEPVLNADYSSRKIPKQAEPLQQLESQLVLLDHDGRAIPGVQILDQNNNQVGSSDVNGVFNIPKDLPYFTTAFAGYDSLTIATAPNLSVTLQSTSELLGQPQKRLVDMMDDGELIRHYSNQLNTIFAREWPLCPNNRENQLGYFTTTSVYLIISAHGTISDLRFFRELDENCQSKISDVLNIAINSGVFEMGRPVSFTFRINL